MQNIGTHSKPSTAIHIFEKVIEPILTYNCEIAQAYMPKSWNYSKFKNKIWEQGRELNKVILGFLRQLLGVHKKTTNIAIQAETGKYPICIKIFTLIIKYWVRLNTCENRLLTEALKINLELHQNGKQSWIKMVEYLLQITNMQDWKASNNNFKENDTLVQVFKKNIKDIFEIWWKKQAIITGENKLDFYYKYKTSFQYEKYLDNTPRHIRIHITRLRTSSHILPIEVQRYNKKMLKTQKLRDKTENAKYVR